VTNAGTGKLACTGLAACTPVPASEKKKKKKTGGAGFFFFFFH